MALTPQEIEDGITALQRAMMSAELSVEYAGRRATFRSMAELETALNMLRREQQAIPATGAAPSSADRGSYAAFSRD